MSYHTVKREFVQLCHPCHEIFMNWECCGGNFNISLCRNWKSKIAKHFNRLPQWSVPIRQVSNVLVVVGFSGTRCRCSCTQWRRACLPLLSLTNENSANFVWKEVESHKSVFLVQLWERLLWGTMWARRLVLPPARQRADPGYLLDCRHGGIHHFGHRCLHLLSVSVSARNFM